MPVTIAADVLPGEVFHGHVASLAPATGAQFSVLPPENATGNFTKIVQRVPVRILLDGDAATLGQLRPGPVGDRRGRSRDERDADERRPPAAAAADLPGELPMATKVFAFASMCVGFFIALLDIQIVSASLRRHRRRPVGRPRRDRLGADQLPDRRDHGDPAVRLAVAGDVDALAVLRLGRRASPSTSLLCGWAWDIESMIVFRALQGFLGGSMIPTVFTTAFIYLQRPAARDRRRDDRRARLAGADAGPDGRRLDHRQLLLALAVLHQPGARHLRRRRRADAGAHRPARTSSLLRGADYLGMVLMALFLGCLEYTLEEGPRWDWFGDDTIRATAWIAGIAGVAFIWRSLTYDQPVVDLRALKSRNFALGCFFSFVTGIGIFATIYLTPLFLGRVRGFSALQIGEAVFSTGVFQICAIPFYTFLARRIDLRWLMMFGLACFARQHVELHARSPTTGAGANCCCRRRCAASRSSSPWRRR